MMSACWTMRLLGALALTATAVASAPAQQARSAPPSGETGEARPPSLVPPGMIMGPGMMRDGMLAGSCDPRALGLAGWRMESVEKTLQLTAEQKAKLDAVRTASEKAVEHFVSNCPRTIPLTPTARLEMLESRLTNVLEGLKVLRTAFDAFYASLDDEQKAHLTPHAEERGWRFEDRPKRSKRGRRR